MSAATESSLFGLSQRLPPTNQMAEQALLGALLANNKALDRVGDFLRPEHFADVIHGTIYKAIIEKVAEGGVADAVSLKAKFEHAGTLDEVGGTAYLAALLTAMVGIINAGEYGQVIYDCWVRRRLIDTGERLVNAAFGADPTLTAAEVAAQAVQAIDTTMEGSYGRDPVSFDTAADESLEILDARMRMDPAEIFTCGLPSLDDALGALEPQDLWVLGGRPGMGKTALGIQIALEAARAGRKVGIISLEMSRAQLARRVLGAAAGVAVKRIRAGKVSQLEVDTLFAAKQRMRGMPILLDDVPGQTVSQIQIKARAMKRRLGGLDLLVLDHLHILGTEPGDARLGNLTAEVGRNSTALKRMAKAMEVRLLALAQLSRGPEGREDKRPTMADLRQSGNIEQDADFVTFIYRPDYYMKSEPEQKLNESDSAYQDTLEIWRTRKEAVAGKAELINAKVRDGDESTVVVQFDGPTTSFREIPQE